jgi:Asp-tRNA(Asn)/Glu-tRNA(Gln) amidotransferase A subunit family amidase
MVVRRSHHCILQEGNPRSSTCMFIVSSSAGQVATLSLIPTAVQTNCLTEIFIDRALERAAWLDEQLKSTGKVVGPLHGLPVSLKDQISIKGLETIMGAWAMYPFGIEMNSGISGYASWIGKVAERNSSLTEILIECGAVLYVRTNVPQTLMVRFTSTFFRVSSTLIHY